MQTLSTTQSKIEFQLAEEFFSNISLFPNPTSGSFSVKVNPDMATGQLYVVDALGRTILS